MVFPFSFPSPSFSSFLSHSSFISTSDPKFAHHIKGKMAKIIKMSLKFSPASYAFWERKYGIFHNTPQFLFYKSRLCYSVNKCANKFFLQYSHREDELCDQMHCKKVQNTYAFFISGGVQFWQYFLPEKDHLSSHTNFPSYDDLYSFLPFVFASEMLFLMNKIFFKAQDTSKTRLHWQDHHTKVELKLPNIYETCSAVHSG